MPIIKSAKKRVRTAKRNYAQNLKYKKAYKKAMADYYKKPSKKKLSQAFSKIDKAAKINLIHKNKAARLKSALSHADL
ncbi:30S ribosomal protein S20 [Patescibacteria group bacterium]|nr:30S ribosomal protein S20 [Patescibacteria group bacterium]